MITLIIFALLLLLVLFAGFFLIFKLIWLLFKKNANAGPLIGAGVCTLVLAILVVAGIYTGYKAITSPFQEMLTTIKTNPAPIYGERTYRDSTYPFELTVYDGMDFSKWISLGNMQLKLGLNTNVFKKDPSGKSPNMDDTLMSILIRQTDVPDASFEQLQKQLSSAQAQRQISITDSGLTQINGLPAYQANGEAYSNRGKLNFWLTAVQAQPNTVYFIGVLSLQNTPQLAEQAQTMTHSLNFNSTN